MGGVAREKDGLETIEERGERNRATDEMRMGVAGDFGMGVVDDDESTWG